MRFEGRFGVGQVGFGTALVHGPGSIEVQPDGLVIRGTAPHRPLPLVLASSAMVGAAAAGGAWLVDHFVFKSGGSMSVVGPAIGGAVAGGMMAVKGDPNRPVVEQIAWSNIKAVKRGLGKGPVVIQLVNSPRGKAPIAFLPGGAGQKDQLLAAIESARAAR